LQNPYFNKIQKLSKTEEAIKVALNLDSLGERLSRLKSEHSKEDFVISNQREHFNSSGSIQLDLKTLIKKVGNVKEEICIHNEKLKLMEERRKKKKECNWIPEKSDFMTKHLDFNDDTVEAPLGNDQSLLLSPLHTKIDLAENSEEEQVEDESKKSESMEEDSEVNIAIEFKRLETLVRDDDSKVILEGEVYRFRPGLTVNYVCRWMQITQ
jgi:antitoxin component of MazEF toxin-antitoxin module